MTQSVRTKILAATLSIAGADGIAAVTNRRIAAAAGVSLGSVTYHFATQTDLLRAALTGFVADETARLTELADAYRANRVDAAIDLTEAVALAERIAIDLSFSDEQFPTRPLSPRRWWQRSPASNYDASPRADCGTTSRRLCCTCFGAADR